MKLASFCLGETVSWGVVEASAIADVGVALNGQFPDLKTLIAKNGQRAALDAAPGARRYPIDDIQWLPVIPNPAKIICVGHNYSTHGAGPASSDAGSPTIFARYADTQTGHNTPMVRPRISPEFDYEGELAVIIGKAGRYIPSSDAMEHVAGYSCYNEGSVRNFQRHTSQYTPGKNFPNTGAFGPWMVTADEIDSLGELRLQTRLNGSVVQDARLNEMIFDVPHLIEYCSSFTRLEPGDVIVTGTPGGIGSRRNPPLWLKPGDTVEVEIDRIGLLRNSVSEEI